MNEIKNNGSDLSRSEWEITGSGNTLSIEGTWMSLRDYFAAKALQGMLACFREFESVQNTGNKTKAYAKKSYEFADAMIEARGK